MRSAIAKKILDATPQSVTDKVKAYGKRKFETFQPSLFGYIPPTGKIPISAERIKEAKALLAKCDYKECAAVLRDVRYKLQDFEKRIGQQRTTTN